MQPPSTMTPSAAPDAPEPTASPAPTPQPAAVPAAPQPAAGLAPTPHLAAVPNAPLPTAGPAPTPQPAALLDAPEPTASPAPTPRPAAALDAPQPAAGPAPTVHGDFVAGDQYVTQIAHGDIVGRDKIINNIQNIAQRALTPSEATEQARSKETQALAAGVCALADRLKERASQSPAHPQAYKGLAEYRLGDAELFVGRERALRELFQKLGNGPLTVLHAEAGLGKTSLLQAGLTPQLLAAGHLPLDLRPFNADPALAIKRAFLADLSQTPVLAAAPLRDFLLKVTDVLGPGTPLTICLDQFEEFFTQLDEATRAGFVRALADCLDDASLPVRWVLALRTEYFGHLAGFRPEVRYPFENDYRLGRLTRAEAEEVIHGPAPAPGPAFETGLADQVLDDLGGGEIAPAQLQLVCAALEAAGGPGATITRALYERAGGVAGILRGYLDNALAHNLPPADRDPAWRLLAGLVEAGAGAASEASLLAHLGDYGVSESQGRRVLAFLETSQLLRRTDERYELASDSLAPRIRAWAAERSALEQARAEAINQMRRIRGSALRGLLGGALGFCLAFLVTYTDPASPVLPYLVIERSAPGAMAGLLTMFLVDVALASYNGRQRWQRWLWGGLGGGLAWALALLFNGLLHSRPAAALAPIALEGAAWGLVTGLGLASALGRPRLGWLLAALTVLAGALALAGLEGYGLGFALAHGPNVTVAPLWRLLAAGAVMPLCLLLVGRLTPAEEDA